MTKVRFPDPLRKSQMRQDASAILALLLGEMKDRGVRITWELSGQLA